MRLGEYFHTDECVKIFEYAQPCLVVSISEQKNFNDLHCLSLPEIINYNAFFNKSISFQTQKKIISQLALNSDWQLLRKTRNRLLFKFLNTPKNPQWNIDMNISNKDIGIFFTLGNDTQREYF